MGNDPPRADSHDNGGYSRSSELLQVTPRHQSESDSSVMAAGRQAGQVQYLGDHVGERDGGADLVIGRPAQQRLDGVQVGEDPVQTLEPIALVSACRSSVRERLDRGTRGHVHQMMMGVIAFRWWWQAWRIPAGSKIGVLSS